MGSRVSSAGLADLCGSVLCYAELAEAPALRCVCRAARSSVGSSMLCPVDAGAPEQRRALDRLLTFSSYAPSLPWLFRGIEGSVLTLEQFRIRVRRHPYGGLQPLDGPTALGRFVRHLALNAGNYAPHFDPPCVFVKSAAPMVAAVNDMLLCGHHFAAATIITPNGSVDYPLIWAQPQESAHPWRDLPPALLCLACLEPHRDCACGPRRPTFWRRLGCRAACRCDGHGFGHLEEPARSGTRRL